MDFSDCPEEFILPSDETTEPREIKLPKPMIPPHYNVFSGNQSRNLSDYGGLKELYFKNNPYGGFQDDFRKFKTL